MDYRHDLEIRVNRAIWADWVELLITERHENKRYIAELITLKEIELGAYVTPSLKLTDMAAQKLMNSLWDCGFRPAQMKGGEGEVKAMREHLEDLRKLVFEVPRLTHASGEHNEQVRS